MTMVSSQDISTETAFPTGNCYKILYSVHTLRLCLDQHLQNVRFAVPSLD